MGRGEIVEILAGLWRQYKEPETDFKGNAALEEDCMKCGDCRFYSGPDKACFNAECRARPPIYTGNGYWMFPIVRTNYWCGWFQERSGNEDE